MGLDDDVVAKLIDEAEQKVKDGKRITLTEYKYLYAVNYGIDNDYLERAKKFIIK